MFKRFKQFLNPRDVALNPASLQDEIVKSIAADVTDLQDGEWDNRQWVFIAVNHEISPTDGARTSSQAGVLAHYPDSPLEKLNFRLSPASKALLRALRETMAAVDKTPWTIANVTLRASGQCDFDFSHDTPPRLSGNIVHSPLAGLLGRYEGWDER